MDEVEELIEQLKSKDDEARANAAYRLGKITDKRAVPALSKALNDEDKYVRYNAARALGQIGDASAVPPLIERLKDEDVNVRLYAPIALRKIGDASAVPALIETLKDKDGGVRMNANRALEQIVENCKTVEDFEGFEEGIAKGSVALRREKDRDVRIDAQIEIAKLTRAIAERKDELAPKKDLLLDDKPKPPKKGRGIYHTARRVRNG